MKIKRSSGVLMAVSSLPSPYGIGTLGKAAYDFIDFLFESGQSYWQMLPLGPTSYGDSPYQSFSSFAGNPYFIDLGFLVEDGLLTRADLSGIDFGEDELRVDYGKIYQNRFGVLYKAYKNGAERDAARFSEFKEENDSWLSEYATFMVAKENFCMRPWIEWEDKDLRLHKPEAVESFRRERVDRIEFYKYMQFLFFTQWKELREYAAKKGIGIIGDIPIYVPLDSADVWSESEQFQLDEDNLPTKVAGVPPDYFAKDGQLWGNPLYDWDTMKKDGYGWWIRRIAGASKLYDIIRIDHFRGFESYYAIPYGSETARVGEWEKGPGKDFVNIITSWFSNIQFIAEDLGFLNPEVTELLRESGLPGMKVLEFAFDWREPSNYLPHTYTNNCVCYVGTHDNNTILGWREEADEKDVLMAREYLGISEDEGLVWGFIRGGMTSVADLFIMQMQDILELPGDARMNVPGTVGGNWQWRTDNGYRKEKFIIDKLAELTRISGRSNSEWLALYSKE